MTPATPAEWLAAYERRTNTHQFEQVAPLIAPDALHQNSRLCAPSL